MKQLAIRTAIASACVALAAMAGCEGCALVVPEGEATMYSAPQLERGACEVIP